MQIETSDGQQTRQSVLPCSRKLLFCLLWIGVCVVVFAVFAVVLSLEDARALALCCFVILGWSVQPGKTPIEYTSLAFLALLVITGAMDWSDAWRGMSQEGIWLIFCGMAMSLALTETRISQRLAQVLCRRDPTWPWLLVRLNLVGGLLALCVPSQVVRCQLVVPIARSVVNQLDLAPGRRSSAVLIALAVSTNHCGAAVLTGGLPNIIAISALQSCGINVTWGFWFIRMAPVYWILSILGNILVLLSFSRGESGPDPEPNLESPTADPSAMRSSCSVAQAVEPMTRTETAILAVFAFCMLMWSTDVLHHIRPTTISLVAVLILFCPVIGLMPFEKLKTVNFPVIIYCASLEALAPLLNAAPAAGPAMSRAAEAAVSVGPKTGPWRLAALFIAGMPLMFCNVTIPVALLVPELCPGQGLGGVGIDPRLGAMIVAAAPSCVVLPFQNAPFLIALAISRDICQTWHFVYCLLGNAFWGFVVVLPMVLAWWSLLGLDKAIFKQF